MDVGPAAVARHAAEDGLAHAVPGDRRGVRESIVGRMARHGGTATVRAGADGTEWELVLAR